ncbi:hypothetical protein NW752_004875 [Fusarium irregulare]|uniref:UBC core domain-containing protein n=1 Tax=Fusarium irregulare TaxID=2494466 RepID=A0A9W8PVL5_9HYPO|nr:hypothetical protein NW766_002838 [Fusarium irregulare]KAJ4021865.1 hypothetical protein NW752_004875 [Fusarium irregulare]
MGIKQFNDDAKAAIEAANRGELPNVSNLRKGESDGEIVFTYTYTYASTYTHTYTHAESPLEIQALSTEPEAYPRHSSFLIFTSSEEPVGLEKWLQEISDLANGKSVTDVIALISNRLTKKLEASSQLDGHISHEDSTTSDIDDDEESFYETEFDDMDIDPIPEREPSLHNEDPSTAVAAAAAITGRLKRHLREARSEGYHLWIPVEDREHGGLHKFSLSIHASKLKIPEEALEAWGLNPSDYVVMMFKLTSEYPLLSTFLEPSDRSIIQFSFGKCTSPNPSSISATRVFEGDDPESADEEIKSRDESSSPFLPLCMSLSFDTLLNKEFPKLLRLRLSEGISWDQAQELYAELSTGTHDTNAVKNHDESSDQFDLELLERNYLSKDADALNIILIAMQFSLQRLVNCPKYCLVCHRRTGNSFETIKPFVCESQLCLFQYLSLGFCQSIEHEIIHNSNVVDLLVSFFYAAIMSNRIREFPTGLGLKCAASAFAPSEIEPISVEVCFENKTIRCGSLDYPKYRSIAKGQFITLCPSSQTLPLTMPIMRGSCRKHICVIDSCKATDFTFEFISTHTAPNVQDDWTNPTSQAGSQTGYANPTWEKALVYKHEQDIDDLEVTERYQALNVMCECMPPVQEMKEYLTSHPGHQLSSWQRMDTSTVSLLNWIVASNRSFIVQDAPIPGLSQPGEEPFKHDNLVDGMADGWVQFRFVQGSPEKEQMFLRELIQRVNNGKPYPTLFAWHGSSLGNWHSIIRTGLDFSQTVNGRAYGNGVYFAKDFETSFSYSRHDGRLWRNSALEITSAITLCEIVNDTSRFVSTSPYFVVNRVDWIQCRYLFIRVGTTSPSSNQTANATPQSIQPTVYVEQDPTHPLKCGLRSVSIPQSALSTSRRMLRHNIAEAVSSSQEYTTTVDESDRRAEINSYLDELLASDDEGDTQPTSGRKRRRTSVDSGLGEARLLATQNRFPWQSNNVTLFQPGQLHLDSLPKLAEPTWAASSPAALRALSSQIKDLQKIQSNTNLIALGWYIDFERLDNLFHWIVELHSFDMDLALAQDMVRCGCSSIVIEVRFGASFPISPPFVRVIRPRFVPFAQGGGGHVTMGGSICSELLTNSGWSPALSLEKVFLEVRMNLCEKDPPARLERSDRAMNAQDYNVFEAIDAYRRAATAHGWQVPSDLEMLKTMMAS